jgi:hypothetical protein
MEIYYALFASRLTQIMRESINWEYTYKNALPFHTGQVWKRSHTAKGDDIL